MVDKFAVFFVYFILVFTPNIVLCQYNVHREDPFALLSGTLVTYQKAACDGQSLSLECPVGTKISIQLVQYGRTAPSDQVCPPTADFPRLYLGNENLNCQFPEALKVIEEKCHGKELCSLVTAPEVFSSKVPATNPCPGVRKYVEIAYQCKPTQFKSRVICHSNTLQLDCGDTPGNLLAIYSSGFESAAGSHIYCPVKNREIQGDVYNYYYYNDQNGYDNDDYNDYNSKKYGISDIAKCESSLATKAVMQICHGKKKCAILADGLALGAPACTSRQNVYLKTVYACVNATVLKSPYRNPTTMTTSSTTTTPRLITSSPTPTTESMLSDLSSFVLGPETEIEEIPPANVGYDYGDIASNPVDSTTEDMVMGFVGDFMSSYNHIRENKAKFILFASLSVAFGLTLFLGLLIFGLYRSSRLARIKANNKSSGSNHMAAYFTSPASSPTTPFAPADTIDLDLEVGDHEVDSAFRDPAPDPLILAPLRTSPNPDPLVLPPPIRRSSPPPSMYGTIRRSSARENGIIHTCDLASPGGTSAVCQQPPSWIPLQNGILKNGNSNRDSPVSEISLGSCSHKHSNPKVVRYSTIGRPKLHSPSRVNWDTDFNDPKSLTLSRISHDVDHVLYG